MVKNRNFTTVLKWALGRKTKKNIQRLGQLHNIQFLEAVRRVNTYCSYTVFHTLFTVLHLPYSQPEQCSHRLQVNINISISVSNFKSLDKNGHSVQSSTYIL